MEVTFGQGQVPAAAVAAPTPAPTPASPTSVPATVPQAKAIAPRATILGDKIPEFKDIILPRLNLVQNIGELKATFVSGCLVLGRQTVLFAPPVFKDGAIVTPATPPVILTVLGFKDTRYSEKVQGSVAGLTVNSEAEVAANGGTLDYKEWELKKTSGMKLFQPLADALVAVQRPAACEKDETTFTFEVEGQKYALALWAMKGSSYTEAAKRVFFTARLTGILRNGYPTYSYSVATREKSYPNGNRAWIPICLPAQKNTAAFLAFAESILCAPEASAPADPAQS